MFSFLSADWRHRAGLMSSTILFAIAAFDTAPATAQQSASPNLLPPVEVDPPRVTPRPKPIVQRAAQAPRGRPPQATASQAPVAASAPAKDTGLARFTRTWMSRWPA